MTKKHGVFAVISQPGDEGLPTFRLEVGCDDGRQPTPRECIAVSIKILEALILETELSDKPEDFILQILHADYQMDKVEGSELN